MIDQEEFERINQLRLQAFRTNESQDVENYYKAASSWFQDELCREVRRSYESAAEITQLRADLAESRASEHGLFGRLETCRQDVAALKAELAAERELADRLASSVEWFLSETETYRGDEPMDDHGGLSWNQINEYWIRNEDIAADILTAHATRRNK